MTKFKSGDEVMAPWGLGEVEGIVVDSFGPADDPFVSVRIDLARGAEGSEPSTIGFRASSLRPVAAPAHQ